jgi:hypothetical protein
MTMDTQILVIVEKSLSDCGSRKFQLDSMGNHLCTCTVPSCTKKTHDWSVDQLTNFFHTTQTVKKQHVTKSRGRYVVFHHTDTHLKLVIVQHFIRPSFFFVRLHSEFVSHSDFSSSPFLWNFEEFNLSNMTVDCSTSTEWCSPHNDSHL